jgi:uncharacterized spore protein YtfJ
MNTKEMMKELTDNFEKSGNVRVCFGDPFEKDDLTIIPVAKIHAKGGAGSGSAGMPNCKQKKSTDGSATEEAENVESKEPTDNIEKEEEPKVAQGGGMGIDINSTPLGYIQISNGEAEFKVIQDSDKIALAGMILSGLTMFMITHAICRLVMFKSKKTIKIGRKVI